MGWGGSNRFAYLGPPNFQISSSRIGVGWHFHGFLFQYIDAAKTGETGKLEVVDLKKLAYLGVSGKNYQMF